MFYNWSLRSGQWQQVLHAIDAENFSIEPPPEGTDPLSENKDEENGTTS